MPSLLLPASSDLRTLLLQAKIFLGGLLLAGVACQAHAAAGRHDPEAMRRSVEQFLQVQSAGLPGQVTVTVGAVDTRLALAACPDPQAFLAPGARAWGKTTVGLRCTAPQAWTLYRQATVAVVADYIASAVPLAQGQTITAAQLISMKGDLTAMPSGIATEMGQVVGRSVTMSLASGTPLRLDILRSKPVVQQGQLVRLVSSGNGFSVSAEARAIGNAGVGQVVQVRTPAGQQISGVARAGGMVEVAF